MNLAPITLFVYNRPEHTLRTLEALAKNDLAEQSVLYIYSDGPKKDASVQDLSAINATREVLRQKKWCKEVEIYESDINYGLADSIVKGVSEVVQKHGKIIVLEDDIVTSPGFLKYMNDALTLYENEERVMHISGYFPPVMNPHELPNTFFYNQTSCWGWATWNRAWQHFNLSAKDLLAKIKNNSLEYSFNLDNTYPFIDHLEKNANGTMKTWAIKWYASVFIKKGLCLHPNLSLVRNEGFDGSGIHCGVNEQMHKQVIAESVEVEAISLTESIHARDKIKKYNTPQSANKPSLMKKLRLYIWKKLKAH